MDDDIKELMAEADIEEDNLVEESIGPNPLSPEWMPYILTKFEKDELDEQVNPTVDGLRRVTEQEIGPILVAKAKVIEPASSTNGLRATVEFTLVIQDKWLGHAQREITDAADVYPGNVKEQMYAQFPVAMAVTRAEGRALRKALKLRKIVASEEVTTVAPEEALGDAPISDVQLHQINNFCKKLDINALKLLSLAKDDDGNPFEDYKHIPRSIGRKICARLGTWLQNKDNKRAEAKDKIPQSLLGYDKDWREEE